MMVKPPFSSTIIISDNGVLVRTRVSEIRELGRVTQGVTLITLDEGAKVCGLQCVPKDDFVEETAEGEQPA
jgi:DNA gyrase subunit A